MIRYRHCPVNKLLSSKKLQSDSKHYHYYVTLETQNTLAITLSVSPEFTCLPSELPAE